MTQHYDVIIVGAGMVGATLALLLAKNSQLNIALVEKEQLSPAATTATPRVSAINLHSQKILDSAGIWQHLDPQRLGPYQNMQVWETADNYLEFEAAEAGVAWLGHIIENDNIQFTAIDLCRQHANITLINPATPTALEQQTLSFDDGQKLTADLIVAADGGRSQIRDWAGIESRGWDYQQSGLVCTVQTDQSHQQTAWQKFLPGGPLAFLPLNDPRQCSIVWSLPTQQAEQYLSLDETAFAELLEQNFDYRLGKVEIVSPRAAFPLKLRHSERYIGEGLALVGDAAHTIHPLAGQGVNIGLLDAQALAEIVCQAATARRKIGSLHTLSKYQRRRRADNLLMQLSMDGFHRIFAPQHPLLVKLRKFGMSQLQKQTCMKNLLMHHAAGQRLLSNG